MIVGFCGEKGVGKDTAGAHLIKAYEFERRAFADPLKKAVAALFNISYWEVDKLKNDPTVQVQVGYENRSTVEEPSLYNERITLSVPNTTWLPISSSTYTFREMLQRFGTEMGRECFGKDFWVDRTLPVGGYYAGRKIVVTDVRFQNEVDRIHEIGGLVCRVMRPGQQQTVDHHTSESTALLKSLDYEIMNDTSVDDFLVEVDRMLDWVLA